MISCKEVFCSELPSPSSIFHSSSNNSNNDATADGLYYQFASERHSLTLQTTPNAQKGEDEMQTSKKSRSKHKEYKFSVERLLPKSKREKKSRLVEPSSSITTNTTTICSAHSSLQRDNISIRAFAIKETTSNPAQHHHSGSSNCSQDDQATVDTHYNSLGGAHNGSGSRSVTTNATAATNTNSKEVTTVAGSGHGGDSTGGEHTSSGDHGIITSSSKYALIIKYHHFVNADNKAETITERINLDFRPISVHVTQLHSTLRSSSKAENTENSLAIPIIGVFVSGDDNKLHFFVATMQALKERLFHKEESVEYVTTTTFENAQCFQPTLCFETIDPSNIISTSASENSSEYHKLSSEEGSVDDNPFMFPTNIMAIDTCVADSHGTNAATLDKVNRLAVACYDGVIRILTYTIECTLDAKSLIRIGKLQHSTFIVDGPVATLDFHCTRQMSDCGPMKEEEENSCDKTVFLLAGSLCGLAFLFYEVPPPSTALPIEGNSFEGPVVVVDGLYDADKEGCEDCVTAVHVMRYHDVTILAVGTQGCRLILFQQQQQQRNQSTGNEATIEHDKQTTLLTAEIENKTEEMMHLSSERDRLTNVVGDLRQKLLEFENNNNSSKEEDVPKSKDHDGDELHDDTTITQSDFDIENDGGEGDGDAKADLPNEGCTSLESTVERLNSIKAEIDDTEQSLSKYTYMIAELQLSIDNLTDKLNDLPIPSPQLDPQSARKLHRYEYLWERKLPYPIQSIGSAVCTQSGLECIITTRQTIHIFCLLSSQMVDAAAASLERKLLSFSTEDSES